jgi:hypothetical protein
MADIVFECGGQRLVQLDAGCAHGVGLFPVAPSWPAWLARGLHTRPQGPVKQARQGDILLPGLLLEVAKQLVVDTDRGTHEWHHSIISMMSRHHNLDQNE